MEEYLFMYIVSLVLVLLAIPVALGKGDFMISGYNTASKEEKAKYNVWRLRLLTASLLVVVAVGLAVAGFFRFDECEGQILGAVLVVILVIHLLLLKYWVKKK